MLVIRLQRVGRRNQGSFRVILTPKRASPRGKVIELLGNWNPRLDQVSLKKERILYWISQGAKPSPTLHNLLVKEKIIEGKKIPKHKKLTVSASAESAPTGEVVAASGVQSVHGVTGVPVETVAAETESTAEEKTVA